MSTRQNALILISKEQQKTRHILSGLQRCLHHNFWKNPEGVDLSSLKRMFQKFILLDQFCRTRKLESLVIPALRKASTETDDLLTKLDDISAHSLHMLWYVYDQLESAIRDGMVSVNALFSALNVYCTDLQTRLTQEENELFPIARRLLSFDEWSAIASQCFRQHGAISRRQVLLLGASA